MIITIMMIQKNKLNKVYFLALRYSQSQSMHLRNAQVRRSRMRNQSTKVLPHRRHGIVIPGPVHRSSPSTRGRSSRDCILFGNVSASLICLAEMSLGVLGRLIVCLNFLLAVVWKNSKQPPPTNEQDHDRGEGIHCSKRIGKSECHEKGRCAGGLLLERSQKPCRGEDEIDGKHCAKQTKAQKQHPSRCQETKKDNW